MNVCRDIVSVSCMDTLTSCDVYDAMCAGPCVFNVGQLYNTQRVYSTVAAGDIFETDDTTRGYLSVGCEFPLSLFGSPLADIFNVLRNK